MSFSFRSWPFPTKDTRQILTCSKFGLIAHAINNHVCIYAEEFGNNTPLLMWTPFEHRITALAWYDASMIIDAAVPVLVMASESGRMDVFDVRSRRVIYKTHSKTDYVTSLQWSQFSSSTFFVGTKNGKFFRYQIEIGQIVKFSTVWDLSFDFAIDHICIEPQFGDLCVIASKNGSLATVRNINTDEPIAARDVVTLTNKTDRIQEIKFYPTSTDFLILITQSNALLYAVFECCTAPLLNLPNIQKFHIVHDSGNVAIVVRSDTVELWKFSVSTSKRLADIQLALSKLAYTNEIAVCDMMGDKVVLVSAGWWLTTVEIRNEKLFVSQRIKLLDSKPLSWSYANEAIIFCTADGQILVTKTASPNFILQMSFKDANNAITANEQQQNETDGNENDGSSQEPNRASSRPKQNDNGDDRNSPLSQMNTTNNNNYYGLPTLSPIASPIPLETPQRHHQHLNTAAKAPATTTTAPTATTINIMPPMYDQPLQNDQSDNSRVPSFTSPSLQIPEYSNSSDSTHTNSVEADSSGIPQFSEFLAQNGLLTQPQQTQQSSSSSASPYHSNPTGFEAGVSASLLAAPPKPFSVDPSINTRQFQSNSPDFNNSFGNFNSGGNGGLDMSAADKHRKTMRTRRSILKSCASSSSLSLLLNENSNPLPSTDDILGQSIVTNKPISPRFACEERLYSSNNVFSTSGGGIGRNLSTIDGNLSPIGGIEGNQISKHRRAHHHSDLGNLPDDKRYCSTANLAVDALLGVNINLTERTRKRRVSSTASDQLKDTILAQIAKDIKKEPRAKETEAIDSNVVNAVTSGAQPNVVSAIANATKKELPAYNYGNNCQIMWCYRVCRERLERVEWVSSTRALAWTIGDGKSNTVFCIDFKHHKVTRLFDKVGFNVTAVTFSDNKKYFIVVVNGFMAVVFQNRIVPKQLTTFTFTSTIFATFAMSSILMVDSNGLLNVARFHAKTGQPPVVDVKRQLKLKSKEHGVITAVFGKTNNLYLGTSTGFLLMIEANKMEIKEVLQMKNPIVEFKGGPRKTFLVIDSKKNIITLQVDGDRIFLPPQIHHASLTASLSVMLIRKAKATCIEVFQSISGNNSNTNNNSSGGVQTNNYTPAYPTVAARCPMMMPQYKWNQSLFSEDVLDTSVCINYGMKYIASLIEARRSPNFTFEQITFLRDLIMDTPGLWKSAFRLSIFLRDFDAAHNIIVNVPPTDKDWQLAMVKAALFSEVTEAQIPSILFSATSLIHNGFIEDGVDILLTAGLWIDAVNLLVQLGMIEEAARITRVYRSEEEESINVVLNVTERMIDTPQRFAYAMTMLCESGRDQQVINELEEIGETAQAKVLALVY